jgi:hypothetical protein
MASRNSGKPHYRRITIAGGQASALDNQVESPRQRHATLIRPSQFGSRNRILQFQFKCASPIIHHENISPLCQFLFDMNCLFRLSFQEQYYSH